MKSEAPGFATAIRALFFDPSGRGEAAWRFFRSPLPLRLCGASFVLAGLALVSRSFAQVGWTAGAMSSASAPVDESLYTLFTALTGLYSLFLSVGLFGLHVLVVKRYRWTRRLSAAGTLLAALAGILFSAGALYAVLLRPPYYAPWGPLETLAAAGYYGQTAGVVLVGVAVLWSRGLGLGRPLPLFAGLVGSPLAFVVLWRLFPPENPSAFGPEARDVLLQAVVFDLPTTLSGVAWICVGLAVFGSRNREVASLTKERRATEDENLSLARRLYEEAWGAGNVAVLDEISAPHLLDRQRDRRGTEGLKQTLSDLRRTFPELAFSIEEQRADGDTVTTRCLFSGTDRGGLLWYPPTNRLAEFTATYTDRFSNGELAEHTGGADVDGLLRQLGLTRPVGGDRSQAR